MKTEKKHAPTLPKAYLDEQRRGIIRWEGEDELSGILAGIKAPAIVRAVNAHEELLEAAAWVIRICCQQLCYGQGQSSRDKALRSLQKVIAIAKAEGK